MATRTFHASADNGVLMITKSGKSDAQLTDIGANPYNYLNDIYFHTNLEYVQMIGKVTKSSITVSSVTRQVISWSDPSGCGFC